MPEITKFDDKWTLHKYVHPQPKKLTVTEEALLGNPSRKCQKERQIEVYL